MTNPRHEFGPAGADPLLSVLIALPRAAVWVLGVIVALNAMATCLLAAALMLHVLGGAG